MYALSDLNFSDELLGKSVSGDDVQKAEDWLYLFASRLGVAREQIVRSFVADELVTAYAYREVCVRKAYSLPGTYNRDGSTDDFYSKKLAYFENRIKQLENKITPNQLTGGAANSAGYRTCEIFRG